MRSNKDINDLYQLFLIIEQNNAIGIPIIETLTDYSQDKHIRVKVKEVIIQVLKDLKTGTKISDAFSKHPKFIPKYIVEMLRINETTGQSNDIYENIVNHLEQEQDLRRNIGSELYIIAIILLSLVAAFFITAFFLLPSISEMFNDLNLDLPFITRIVISAGEVVTDYWFFFVIGFWVVFFWLAYMKLYQPEKFALGVLNIPIYRGIIYNDLQFRFARIFSVCVSAGLPTVKALELTAGASDNILLQDTIRKAIGYMNRSGMNIVEALEKANIYNAIDNTFYKVIAAGTKGNMADIMDKRAKYFHKELAANSKTFGTKLSNMVIIPGFALLLGMVAVSALPIFTAMGGISKGGFGM